MTKKNDEIWTPQGIFNKKRIYDSFDEKGIFKVAKDREDYETKCRHFKVIYPNQSEIFKQI